MSNYKKCKWIEFLNLKLSEIGLKKKDKIWLYAIYTIMFKIKQHENTKNKKDTLKKMSNIRQNRIKSKKHLLGLLVKSSKQLPSI